jgi:hypothetical protein
MDPKRDRRFVPIAVVVVRDDVAAGTPSLTWSRTLTISNGKSSVVEMTPPMNPAIRGAVEDSGGGGDGFVGLAVTVVVVDVIMVAAIPTFGILCLYWNISFHCDSECSQIRIGAFYLLRAKDSHASIDRQTLALREECILGVHT